MNRPESGSSQAAQLAPPATLAAKQARMSAENRARTPVHWNRFSIHEPRNRPAARRTKKINAVGGEPRSAPAIAGDQRGHPDVDCGFDRHIQERSEGEA